MAEQNNVTFKWSNYFRPTPRNLQLLTEGLKYILGTIAVTQYATDNVKTGFWLMLVGAILETLSKFFARVQRETEVITVTKVTVPAGVDPGQVESTTEVKEKEQ